MAAKEVPPGPGSGRPHSEISNLLAQFPKLPGAALPRSAGLLVAVLAAFFLEVFSLIGIPVPLPGALLVLVVAIATYLDGAKVGIAAGLITFGYEAYNLLWRGTVLRDTAPLSVRMAGLVAITMVTILIISRFRRRLDDVIRSERRLLEEAEAKQRELAAALANEERAQEAVRFQARLLEAVGQAVVATDVSGRIVYWNGPAADLFRVTAAQALRQPVTQVIPETSREGTLARLRRGESWAGEMEVVRPDGSRVTVMVNDSPIRDEAGNTLGLVRIATDVTARKHVERAQRLLAEAGSALSSSMDYESTIRTVARLCVPTFAELCVVDIVEEDGTARRLEVAHADPELEAIVRDLRQTYPIDPDSSDPVAEVIRTGMLRFFPVMTKEALRAAATDGRHAELLEKLDFRSSITAPLRAGGKTLGAISFYRGAKDQPYERRDLLLAQELANRAATAIHQARLFEAALIASRAKSDFLAVMSHELRTPLTTVTGYTDLMLAGVPEPLPERHRNYVERIRLAATHLLTLIEQILVYARLELGRERAHPERVRVSDMLREAALLMEPVAAERGVQFKVEPPSADTIIESDPTKLRQILLNLLANALKFTDQGEVSLKATAQNGEIVFVVRDTGIGIPKEHQSRIFDAFWQVDQSSTRRAGGAGLGLSVTRKLAHVLGGDVAVESQEGQGAAFFVRLPIRWSSPDDDTVQTAGSNNRADLTGGARAS